MKKIRHITVHLALFGLISASIAPIPALAQSASTTGTTTSVASGTSSATLLEANNQRAGATISNDSTAILYILLGSGTASATNYTYALAAKGTVSDFIEVPVDWKGQVKGIWASANGAARVTERTR